MPHREGDVQKQRAIWPPILQPTSSSSSSYQHHNTTTHSGRMPAPHVRPPSRAGRSQCSTILPPRNCCAYRRTQSGRGRYGHILCRRRRVERGKETHSLASLFVVIDWYVLPMRFGMKRYMFSFGSKTSADFAVVLPLVLSACWSASDGDWVVDFSDMVGSGDDVPENI